MKTRHIVSAVVGLAVLATTITTVYATSCGPPPSSSPQRIKGGESFPPLPLPVTPLRRTEKKRPPSPPVLVVKVRWGAMVKGEKDGKPYFYEDWTTDPNDIKNLLKTTTTILDIPYTSREMPLDEFDFDPAQTPVLYFTGHEAISFSDGQRAKLRAYVVQGGTIWGDACCGSDDFATAFRNEMGHVFPTQPLRILPVDHPIYSIYYTVTRARYKIDARFSTDVPKLEGISIGCRAAVIFSPYDLSCGWDNHTHDTGKRYDVADANRLGINMTAYALAYYKTGLMLRHRVEYAKAGPTGDNDFFIGKIVHDGDWDTDPNALQNLMLAAGRATKVKVNFQERPVELVKADLFDFPFLYMSGHDSFTLSDEEIGALRKYLEGGGFLLADACCGRAGFDLSFRKLATALFPDAALERLPDDHEIFKVHATINTVQYTPLVQAEKPGFASPHLEGVTLDGRLVLVYSRYDLGNGWEQIPHPHTRGVASSDAFKIGINAIIYTMTH
ncbi:MAG: DUF4159 domain-containing protein [Verrucomicrobia bacterium]|nr:DUF4159 domain-containing protein [Verrucomicrobiota bacterium]